MLFRRRHPQPQLIVGTHSMRRISTPTMAPPGPSLPTIDAAMRKGVHPQADVAVVACDSGSVIAFLASGGSRSHLSTRVYDVITSPEGCGLGRTSSLDAFAEQFCDSAEGRRQLVQALAVLRPASDPTARLTRMAITVWVRTVGLAALGREVRDAAATGLPDWHTPGDM